MLQREKLLTSGFQSPLALTERRGTGVVREAWTDIGDVGAGRRSDLTRNETNRQISTSLGWTQSECSDGRFSGTVRAMIVSRRGHG